MSGDLDIEEVVEYYKEYLAALHEICELIPGTKLGRPVASEAVAGVKRLLARIAYLEKGDTECPQCEGKGKLYGEEDGTIFTCWRCKGKGRISNA